jgi:ABC-type uncharacterized transport system permease subunit
MINVITIICYIISTLLGYFLQRDTVKVNLKFWFILSGLLAVALHAYTLYLNIHVSNNLNLGFFNAMSLMALVTTCLILFTSMIKPTTSLVTILFPFAALSIGLAAYYPSHRILPLDIPNGVKIHIFFSILAYSLLALSAFQSLLIAFQDYSLRHKHPRHIIKFLPPLKTMEIFLFQIIYIGFIFLSISLISGVIFLDDIFGQHLLHKTILSLIAWLIFTILIWGNWRYGWRGNTVVRWDLGGFIVLMLAYFGSKFVLELILKVIN